MTGDALFDMAPAPPSRESEPRLSPDARRTIRQSDAIRAGHHPLGLAFGGRLPLHPDAIRDPEQRNGGPRCGDCAQRVLIGYHNRTYAKCEIYESHSAATDVRAWWPACWKFKPDDAA